VFVKGLAFTYHPAKLIEQTRHPFRPERAIEIEPIPVCPVNLLCQGTEIAEIEPPTIRFVPRRHEKDLGIQRRKEHAGSEAISNPVGQMRAGDIGKDELPTLGNINLGDFQDALRIDQGNAACKVQVLSDRQPLWEAR
jgi:hypothetical protein